MREIRSSGSEGGAAQTNEPSLPLSPSNPGLNQPMNINQLMSKCNCRQCVFVIVVDQIPRQKTRNRRKNGQNRPKSTRFLPFLNISAPKQAEKFSSSPMPGFSDKIHKGWNFRASKRDFCVKKPKPICRLFLGLGIVAVAAISCPIATASGSVWVEEYAAVDAEQFAAFIEHEVLDLDDLAEGAEIQRRRFNRMTPPGVSWVQPMVPPVAPFDAEFFDDLFLSELLGEDKNSVAVFPLSLALDPQTRETLVYNADGLLIAVVPADPVVREWREDADPARVTLQLDLLPMEDVEPYLYTERRIAEYNEAQIAEATKAGGTATRGLGSNEFGIAGIQRMSNGNMQITVSNGLDSAEVFAYTVWHTSSVSVVVWTNEYDEVLTNSHTAWHPTAPAFDGIESEWECLTTNLALVDGVGVFEDTAIPPHARLRFYAVANPVDSDGDGLSDAAERLVYKTDPHNPDTDGDGWSDAEELVAGTDPLDRLNAPTLARGVVLNEVLYNPSGSDMGKEWIELYSAGRYPVNLGGFAVQVGDMDYTNAYVFPENTWLEPGRFLLLGGTQVTNRDVEVNFELPNRFIGDATAAVRLAAEVGTNTLVADCLMYGGSATDFNANGLDATGWESTSTRSAGAGNSLYRLFVGHDTDRVEDWGYRSAPQPRASLDIPDTDGDGLTDQEELTGSRNPYGEPTDYLNADSDGDGLSDYDECVVHGTNPNTWATDGDIFPWPPPSGLAVDWWGSDSYEIANGWNPLVADENANGIPDSWEMAFPGTNLFADADGDGVSNVDELEQNSDPFDDTSSEPQAYVLRFEATEEGWSNDGTSDIGLNGEVKVYFTGLKEETDVTVWVREGSILEEFTVTWDGATPKGETWVGAQEVFTSATLPANSTPYLLIQDAGLHPHFTNTLGGEYRIDVIKAGFIDEYPDYSLDSNMDSDNFFLREYDGSGNPDFEELDIYYRILPEDLDVSDVRIVIYKGNTSEKITFDGENHLDGEVDGGSYKTGDNLHVTWSPNLFDQDSDPGFYRVQLEVYVAGQTEPICKTSIDDADISTPGWQCPQDALAVHDLVWKHRPVVYLGTGEVVGPPQDPFNSIVRPWMRHKNGMDKLDPDSDTSEITPPPTYNDFGSLTSADTENILWRSESTANPYFDIHDDHLQATAADGVLWHYTPLDAGASLKHNNYAFIQFWMYEPSSHGVFNNTGVGSNQLTHEGDWEMCQFTIRLKNPDDPHTKKYWVDPFAATASQHYYGQTLLWDRNHNGPAAVDQNYVLHENDGNRVNIFIAENAHATYFRGGIIDTDIFKGCGTQVQYNNTGMFGYDRVVPASSPTPMAILRLQDSYIYDWSGEWGQTYSMEFLWWTVKRFAGPRSPLFREAQIEDGNPSSHLSLATDPEAFHNWCRKTSLSTEQELR